MADLKKLRKMKFNKANSGAEIQGHLDQMSEFKRQGLIDAVEQAAALKATQKALNNALAGAVPINKSSYFDELAGGKEFAEDAKRFDNLRDWEFNNPVNALD